MVCGAAAGCGSGLGATVEGVVTYQGAPLTLGNIAFHPASGAPAYGAIGEDGSYTLQTASQPGVPPGDYRVSIVSREVLPSKNGLPPMPGRSFIPPSYGGLETSGLTFTVEPGDNRIDIELVERPN